MRHLLIAAIAAFAFSTGAQARVQNSGAYGHACDAVGGRSAFPSDRPIRDKIPGAAEYNARLGEGQRKYAIEDQQRAEMAKRRCEAETAERQQQEVAAQTEAEGQAERKQQAEEKARVDTLPHNVVFRAYTRFIWMKTCNDLRGGYLVQYINDADMERANKAVKAIVAKAKSEDYRLDTDDIWHEAEKEVRRLSRLQPFSMSYCNDWAKKELFAMSPVSLYPVEKPRD